MIKLIDWLSEKIVPWLIVFLLFFIPLYPKLPLLSVKHTWVYIRLEDVFIAIAVFLWLVSLVRKKISLPQVIFKPIILYWLVGLISTVIATIFIFPKIANVFPNVAVFHYLRRIEYLILVFVAASTIKKEKDISKFIIASAVSMFGVIIYGFGQKLLGFPAFLTMNEEFAKGIPLYLPPGARITSTFGGHYDLAAFLVLMISLFGSLFFGVKQKLIKTFFIVLAVGGLSLLLMTASRVSFAVYLVTISLMLILQKKKILIIPVIIFSLLLLAQVKGMVERFAKTFRIQPIVINTATGQPIAVLEKLPPEISGLKPTPEPVSETLPLGTGFIALPPISKTEPEATSVAVVRRPISSSLKLATISSEISTISGSFLIQKAFVYDISFTTRFQGEWPRAWAAFIRNPLTGSGYSSISLATDNDYLRALGETGILGFLSFFLIVLTFFIMTKRSLAKITNPLLKCFVIGLSAGITGLGLNAILIDVFEASKVAFILWILVGIAVGAIGLYAKEKIYLLKEIAKVLTSSWMLYIYLLLIILIGYGRATNGYFAGDDFVWLKEAARSDLVDLIRNFYNSNGFFYRPLAKILYFIVYSIFWLKPLGYHFVSILIFFLSACFVYKIANAIWQKKLESFLAAVIFVLFPINSESVMWVSSYSGLLMTLFTLCSFYFYLDYERKERKLFLFLLLVFFILGLFSHEGGVVLPLIVTWYGLIKSKFSLNLFWQKRRIVLIFLGLILVAYFALRTFSNAHGLSGDYNYHFSRLPYNFLGNLFGYLSITLAGFEMVPFYNLIRQVFREHLKIASSILFFLAGIIILLRVKIKKTLGDQQIIILFGLFLISLIPYLGLGNLAERYGLLGSSFLAILIIHILAKTIDQTIGSVKIKHLLLIITVFIIGVWYHYDLQKVAKNWIDAGETARKTIYAIKDNYRFFPKDTTLFFVNVPIRINRSWVFPVGLPEAVWFVYRDETFRVVLSKSVEEALKKAENTPNAHVFSFEGEWLKEVTLR